MFENKKIFVLGMARSGYHVAKLLANANELIVTDKNKMKMMQQQALTKAAYDVEAKIYEEIKKVRITYNYDFTNNTNGNNSGDPNQSICPAGWRLPKGGPNGEFQALYDAGYNTPALMMKDAGGPHFVLSGAREAGSTEATGEIGRYWSSTAVSNDTKRAYRFYVSNTKVETSAPNIYGKHRGLSIRCINDKRN